MADSDRFTRVEVDELLARARREAEESHERRRREDDSNKRAATLHGMEIRLAELIGADGDGGSFNALGERVEQLAQAQKQLEIRQNSAEEFINKLKWSYGLIATASGAFIALGTWALQHYLK